MKKLRQNKGITLIALIITIIVMLILVGVTINVALNGNLFGKAETATKETNKAVEKEQLMAVVISAYDAKTGAISKQTLESELGTGWQVTGEEGGPYVVTSPKENVYKVTKTGEIAEVWVDNGDGTFTKGDTTVEIGKTTYDYKEVQEKLGATGGTYTGTWTVIGAEGDKLKLVSTTNVSSVSLGYTDQNVYKKDAEGNITTELKDEIVDLDGDGYLTVEKAVWSYAHAVNTLNEEAKKATGITSAESITIEDIYDIIGEENVDKGSSYGTVYNYYFDTSKSKVCSKKKTGTDENGEEQWELATNISIYATQIFVDSEGRTVIIDANNPKASAKLPPYDSFKYALTDAQKSAIGGLATGYYWLASPCVDCGPYGATFCVRYMSDGLCSDNSLFESTVGAIHWSSGVRAVVLI